MGVWFVKWAWVVAVAWIEPGMAWWPWDPSGGRVPRDPDGQDPHGGRVRW